MDLLAPVINVVAPCSCRATCTLLVRGVRPNGAVHVVSADVRTRFYGQSCRASGEVCAWLHLQRGTPCGGFTARPLQRRNPSPAWRKFLSDFWGDGQGFCSDGRIVKMPVLAPSSQSLHGQVACQCLHCMAQKAAKHPIHEVRSAHSR